MTKPELLICYVPLEAFGKLQKKQMHLFSLLKTNDVWTGGLSLSPETSFLINSTTPELLSVWLLRERVAVGARALMEALLLCFSPLMFPNQSPIMQIEKRDQKH